MSTFRRPKAVHNLDTLIQNGRPKPHRQLLIITPRRALSGAEDREACCTVQRAKEGPEVGLCASTVPLPHGLKVCQSPQIRQIPWVHQIRQILRVPQVRYKVNIRAPLNHP